MLESKNISFCLAKEFITHKKLKTIQQIVLNLKIYNLINIYILLIFNLFNIKKLFKWQIK